MEDDGREEDRTKTPEGNPDPGSGKEPANADKADQGSAEPSHLEEPVKDFDDPNHIPGP